MPKCDPRVDEYIAGAPEFARPILEHLRASVHRICPLVEETVKWRMPSFQYHGLMCAMAAFKQHCTFSFWKEQLVVGGAAETGSHGQFGRIQRLQDLPSDKVLAGYLKKAMQLNESGTSTLRARRAPRAAPATPEDLAAALKKNKNAASTFAAFSASCKREYVEWITEAKREDTRAKRVATAVEWMADGKQRNWKYQNC